MIKEYFYEIVEERRKINSGELYREYCRRVKILLVIGHIETA